MTADPATTTAPVEVMVLSDAQAAGLLGCSRSHFRNMNRLGLCPAPVKLGRLSRWRRAELIAWVNAATPPRHRWNWRPQK